MLPRAPDRELRRMVVDLAALMPEDVAAVLGELSEEQRGTIERLLRDFSGFGFGEATQKGAAQQYDVTKFSPWLVAKLEGKGGMTHQARTVSQECALEMFPVDRKNSVNPDMRRPALSNSQRKP